MADVFQVFNPRIVSAEEIRVEPVAIKPDLSGDYQRWQPSQVADASSRSATLKGNAAAKNDFVNELDMAREAAKKEGYQQGLEEGHAEAKRILAEQSQQLQMAMAALREPQKWVDTELERELFTMTMALSRQLLRHELSVRPDLIENLVHKAIDALPITSGDLNIYLNPADVDILRALAKDRGEDIEPSWILLEDPTVTRGGCRISNDYSRIDEELETRLERISAEMLGEQSAMLHTDGQEHQ